jgi:DNA-binding transcriptional MerR regulator
MASTQPSSPPRTSQASNQPVFRSGAVARMARMPVSTLRIWEQRYQAVRPTAAPSGHRMYSSADVERVVLLRRLTGVGHAIGSLAGLDNEQLQKLALMPVSGASERPLAPAGRGAPLRVVVVGQAMARRLQRLAAAHHRAGPLQVIATFASLADAAQATAAGTPRTPVDLLLWQTSGLQAVVPPELKAAREAWKASRVAVCYRFAAAAGRDALAATGAVVAREPADDEALGAWLATVAPAAQESAEELAGTEQRGTSTRAWVLGVLGPTGSALPARRFDDAALTEFANISSTVACECPRHVAELLIQLSSFEAYTAECGNRNAADAHLHAELQRVAGAARLLFESALERVAVAEGLALP